MDRAKGAVYENIIASRGGFHSRKARHIGWAAYPCISVVDN